jgi:RNA polymerase sigma-70 factor (ECF subfamily)
MRSVEINGQPGALYVDADGNPVAAVTLDIVDDQVQTLHAVSNPEKLRHIDPFTGSGSTLSGRSATPRRR